MKMKVNAKTYRKARKVERAIINYLMDEMLIEEGYTIEINHPDFYMVGADAMEGTVAVYRPRCRKPENCYPVYINTAMQRVEWRDYMGRWYIATGNIDEYRGDLIREYAEKVI